jgi:hypothetical protein
VTRALLVADDPPATQAGVRRLCDQLRRHGVDEVLVLDRVPVPGDAAAHDGSRTGAGPALAALRAAVEDAPPGRVVVGDAALVVSDSPVGDLLADPRLSTAVLVARGARAGAGPADVRTVAGRVQSVGTVGHTVTDPDATGVGLLVVGPADRPALLASLAELAELAGRRGWSPDPVRLALLGLVRSGVAVTPVPLGPFVAGRGGDDAQARELLDRVAALDEPALRRRGSARAGDGFYSTFVVRRLSQPVTAFALRRGLRPNQVTVASFAVGLLAAAAFAVGAWPATLAGAVLLQVSLILDCTDGEIARYTRGYTALGAWLDAVSDRAKEYLVYAGLAAGAVRAGHDATLVWALAGATLALQVTRHVVDLGFWFRPAQPQASAGVLPLDRPDDGVRADAGGAAGLGRGAEGLSRRTEGGAVGWAKRVVTMPIGERWLVVSTVSVVAGAPWVFVVLLALGTVALAYTTAGRVLRAAADPPSPPSPPGRRLGRSPLDQLADVGVLGRLLLGRRAAGPLGGRYGWLLPAAFRAVEYGGVLGAVWLAAPDALPAAYGLLCVAAYHHYDTVYRLRLVGRGPAGWIQVAGLGWEGRLVAVLLILALVPAGAVPAAVAGLAAVLGAAVLGESLHAWWRWLSSRPVVGAEVPA